MTGEGGRNQWMIWQFHSWMMACQYSVNYKIDVGLYVYFMPHVANSLLEKLENSEQRGQG